MTSVGVLLQVTNLLSSQLPFLLSTRKKRSVCSFIMGRIIRASRNVCLSFPHQISTVVLHSTPCSPRFSSSRLQSSTRKLSHPTVMFSSQWSSAPRLFTILVTTRLTRRSRSRKRLCQVINRPNITQCIKATCSKIGTKYLLSWAIEWRLLYGFARIYGQYDQMYPCDDQAGCSDRVQPVSLNTLLRKYKSIRHGWWGNKSWAEDLRTYELRVKMTSWQRIHSPAPWSFYYSRASWPSYLPCTWTSWNQRRWTLAADSRSSDDAGGFEASYQATTFGFGLSTFYRTCGSHR